MVLLAAMATGSALESFSGGLTWQALLTAGCEGAISVGLSLWLLGLFQRRFDHAGPVARALGRSAFGAYLLQVPVLLICALLVHPLPIPPEAKFLLVALAGVAASLASPGCSHGCPACGASCEPSAGTPGRGVHIR